MPDRNFDGIAARFHHNIYGNPKGQLRLALCQRELSARLGDFLSAPRRVWDAGGGIGQMSAWFLEAGHQVYLNDLSSEMLALAKDSLHSHLGDRLELECTAIQSVEHSNFDLTCCHAVLEWVDDAPALLQALHRGLRPGGYLSLMFYNLNALVINNMVKGNLYKLRDEDFAGHPGGLTPPHPRDPEAVLTALRAQGFEIVAKRAVRLSHDLMSRSLRKERSVTDMLEIDWQYGDREPFWALGRYVHVLCRR
ncbi:methyltransferase domain-containing protein [Spongiibacter sp. KMU-166]|uniref:tRNA 5-carboxymethoxyuridine methyltransferase n=1 Tax=Spongiibacter thalassae TaxID=2721624 RepID=A0ABX1GKV3_9GAMM|nr:methyltransferase domain-containing protein [Spongiibacter thalassae]NKI19605.1 methyltransferase domain-containing protein [Spongiibacter thalassae]